MAQPRSETDKPRKQRSSGLSPELNEFLSMLTALEDKSAVTPGAAAK
jgi:hypothetical protein